MKVEGQGIAVSQAVQVANEAAKAAPAEKPNNHALHSAVKEENTHKSPLKEKDLIAAADVLNEAMKISNYHLQFKVHKESGRLQVKVLDADNKVIREIPPEKILDCSARIKELIDRMAGILVDELV